MIFRSRLPQDRTKLGEFEVEEDGRVVAGPFPCYAKSDNQAAQQHGNWDPTEPDGDPRDDTKPYGDHPAGEWIVRRVVRILKDDAAKRHTYGPVFIAVEPMMDPSDGFSDAERRAINGGYGIGLHGGELNANGKLRPTHGCLRLRNADLEAVAPYAKPGVAYVSEAMPPEWATTLAA